MKELQAKIDQLLDALGRMSPREQLFVGIGVASFIVFVVVLVSFSIRNSLAIKQKRVAALKRGVAEIAAMEDEFKQAQARKEAFIRQLEQNKINLRSKIGTIATELGITIDSVDDASGSLSSKSNFKEKVIKISVRKIDFVDMFEFFKRIESVSDLLYIKNVKIRRRYDNPEQVDVTFYVATIVPKEE